ncbi:MAG: NTP transferase domain-containing protein [Chloroflexota bacterium]|nr:NTP transferase domain-containing protein [Chloroflexota bacterium]
MIGAVVIAGGNLGVRDALLDYTGVPKKALIPVAGKAMVNYVVEALAGCQRIRRIVVVGLEPEDGVQFGVPVDYVADQGKMLENALAGVDHLIAVEPQVDRIVLSAADIPLVTAEIVGWFIETCLGMQADIFYSIVERSVMERRFPGSGRSFRTLSDGSFAGGDLFLVSRKAMTTNLEFVRKVTDSRKGVWGLVRLLGFMTLLRFSVRRLSLAQVEQRASKILGYPGRAVIAPYAELAMDVDKPYQLDLVRASFWRAGEAA